jgi:hypothetical protein
VVDAAEVVGDAVLAAMADEQEMHLTKLRAAVRAHRLPRVDRRVRSRVTGLPVRPLDRPGDDVFQAAEGGTALADRLVQAEAVVGLHPLPAPRTAFRCGHAGG